MSDDDPVLINSLSDLPLEDAIRQKLEAMVELNILVVGRYQVGKSTLINSLFFKKGERYIKRAKEGSGHACTRDVTPYTLKSEGVTFNIYDSPGLQDEKDDLVYLQLIARKCPNIHLIIYCKEMSTPITPAEKAALKNLNTAFGQCIWNNAIFALTFADSVDPPNPEANKVDFFKDKIKSNVTEFEKAFNGFSIKLENLETNIHPVGSARVLQLPGMGEDWRVDFWRGCIEACRDDAKGAMLKLAWFKDLTFFLKILLISLNEMTGTLVTATGILAPPLLISTGITSLLEKGAKTTNKRQK